MDAYIHSFNGCCWLIVLSLSCFSFVHARLTYLLHDRRGLMTRPYSHIRLVLREIDFKLRIYLEPTIRGKKEWLNLQVIAEADERKAQEERAEMEQYMARQRQIKEEEDKKTG